MALVLTVTGKCLRSLCVAALLVGLGACSGKRIASIDGVRSVELVGRTLVVELDLREPATASDTPIALGQVIAAISDRMRHGLPRDVGPSTVTVLIKANYVIPGRISADAFMPGQTARMAVAALKTAGRTDQTPQTALDLIQSTEFTSMTAASDARIFCDDPAHLAASPDIAR